MTVNEKIAALRKRMKECGVKAYVIPSSDSHMSEYVADHWKARSWISGFTGSAGTVVVTENESGLWTDGRYFIQAEKQLEGSEIKLFKMGQPKVPTFIEWIVDKLGPEDCAGFSGKVVSVAEFKDMKDKFSAKDLRIEKKYDFIADIWTDRPAIPATEVFLHEKEYTGLTAAEKLDRVRAELGKAGAQYYVIASLDDIAWLFNIRADDVAYVPVSICYALVTPEGARLFIDGAKVPEKVKAVLTGNGVSLEGYEDIGKALEALPGGSRIAFDPKRINCWIYDSIHPECRKVEIDEIITRMKAVKNETEIANIRNSQVKDGVAMVNFLYWLDKNIGKETITEITIAEKLKYFRGQQDKNMGEGFTTIAGYRDHGAMMHYSATEESAYSLENKDLIVIDSGGQYLDGTTDITRTVVFDEVTEEQKRDFTLVLKAHIGLTTARFLYGATGSNLDILARYPIWAEGLDYRCGTGHGLGYFLSVHEGPQRFSPIPNTVKLEKGMLLTNEPGIYTEGKYGVRTENTVLVTSDITTEYGEFLKLETISWCPIDLRGVVPGMLTEKERSWLNDYHEKVYEKLSPFLEANVKEWLKYNTRRI